MIHMKRNVIHKCHPTHKIFIAFNLVACFNPNTNPEIFYHNKTNVVIYA